MSILQTLGVVLAVACVVGYVLVIITEVIGKDRWNP